MSEPAILLVTLGGLLLLGLATEALGRLSRLPRVTLLLLFGFAIGPSGLDFLPPELERWFATTTALALVMIGFLLGEKCSIESMRSQGGLVLRFSVVVSVVTALVVTLGLLALGAPLDLALLLGAISTATAPAASSDVVREMGAKGPFSRALLGVVALDDAWGLVLFSAVLALASTIAGGDGTDALLLGLRDLGGGVLVGLLLGVPAAYLTGRVSAGEPTLLEALGIVFLCGGIALWLEVSFLVAAMVLGFVVASLARHHARPFHAIEDIEQPFLVLFFVFAGATFRPETIGSIGLLGVAYVGLRIVGRVFGGLAAGALGPTDPAITRWMGIALLPQAGVALGLALVAVDRFPELESTLLPLVVGATVFFELVGPVMTRVAVLRADGDR